MSINAIILNGGNGERLKPLTLAEPRRMIAKSLVRVLGTPLWITQRDELRRSGIQSLDHLTMRGHNRRSLSTYLQSFEGVGHYPLDMDTDGSASALLTFASESGYRKGQLLLLPNDNLVYGLPAFPDAPFTMISVSKPGSETIGKYGVMLPKDGMIDSPEQFLEQPRSLEALCAFLGPSADSPVQINTAVYRIDISYLHDLATQPWVRAMMGEGSFGVSSHLIPQLLARGQKIAVVQAKGWSDFGNRDDYLVSTRAALEGNVPPLEPGFDYVRLPGNVWIHRREYESGMGHQKAAELIRTGSISAVNTRIGPNVSLSPGVILRNVNVDADSVIEGNVTLEDAQLFEASYIGPFATVKGSILCQGAYVGSSGSSRTILECTVVGARAVVRPGSHFTDVVMGPQTIDGGRIGKEGLAIINNPDAKGSVYEIRQ